MSQKLFYQTSCNQEALKVAIIKDENMVTPSKSSVITPCPSQEEENDTELGKVNSKKEVNFDKKERDENDTSCANGSLSCEGEIILDECRYSKIDDDENNFSQNVVPLDYRLDWSIEMMKENSTEAVLFIPNISEENESINSVSADWELESLYSYEENNSQMIACDIVDPNIWSTQIMNPI